MPPVSLVTPTRRPDPVNLTMPGFAALIANGGVAVMLYRFRGGDANMRSVWIC